MDTTLPQLVQMLDMSAKLEYMNYYEQQLNKTPNTLCYAMVVTAVTSPLWAPLWCHEFIEKSSFICEQKFGSNHPTTLSIHNKTNGAKCRQKTILIGTQCWSISGRFADGSSMMLIASEMLAGHTLHYISTYLSAWTYGNEDRQVVHLDTINCLEANFLPGQRLMNWIRKHCVDTSQRPKHNLVPTQIVSFSTHSCDVNTQFMCTDGICILNTYVCDGNPDCLDNSDELECSDSCYIANVISDQAMPYDPQCEYQYSYFRCSSGQCVPVSSVCDLIAQCNDMSDEVNCLHTRMLGIESVMIRQTANTNTMHASPGVCPQGFSLCNTWDQLSCYQTHKWCVHERNREVLLHCPRLEHLYHCEDYSCGDTMFKCPGSYCVQTYMVCDSVPDCPNGEDEESCSVLMCPGHLKCPPPPALHIHKIMVPICNDFSIKNNLRYPYNLLRTIT